MSTPYTITKADVSHAEQLFRLVNEAYRRELTLSCDRFDTPDEIREIIVQTEKIFWLILLDQDKLVGSLLISKEDDGRYSMGAFAIDKNYKGQGLVLLQRAESDLRSMGVTELFLQIVSVAKQPISMTQAEERRFDVTAPIQAENDTLASLYEKYGFKFTGSFDLPSLVWQRETRKKEYITKIFLREMVKPL